MATKAEQTTNAAETPTPQPKTAADLVGEIGTLTYPRAIAAFGEQNAVHVMKEVARIGGHGIFEEAELRHPLFGGLAMPHPDSIAKPNKADFDKLPEPEFYYQAALEDHATLRRKAADDRAAINDLFNQFKK